MTAPVTIPEDQPLTEKEQADFEKYENTLRAGFETMEKMAVALRDIQKRKLYRGTFRTFESYVRTKWDMAISRAYQLCNFAGVIENLRLHNCGEIPANEAQTRELAKLPAEEQPKVWEAAVANGNTTAAAIAETAEQIAPRPKPAPVKPPTLNIEAEVLQVVDTGRPAKHVPQPRRTRIIGLANERPENPDEQVIVLRQPQSVTDTGADIAYRNLCEAWNAADELRRRRLFDALFGSSPRIPIRRAIDRACKKDVPEPVNREK